MRPRENLVVARVFRPFPGPDHIVTVTGELDPRSTPDTTIEQNLHADFLSMCSGSILS